jgi:peptide/nickel transport system substrate-binding protein
MKTRLLALLALLIALVVAPAALAQEGRVLRLDEAAVGELDPAKATDYADSMLMFNLYDTLVWSDASGAIVPLLAEEWTISEDGRTYTFDLRSDVTFHDGSSLTADDVVFSLERTLAINQGYAYLFDGWVEAVASVDDGTVEFTLSRPYAPFLASLVRLPIVNRDLVLDNVEDGNHGEFGDYGQAFLSGGDAGTGAYTVVSHNPQELTVMERYDGYFQGFAETAPDTVRLRYSLQGAAVRTLLSRGEHEVSSQWLPTETFKALANDGVPLVTEGGSSVFFLKLNTQRAPTDDVHFRRAMALAFDYEALLSILAVNDEVTLGQKVAGPLPQGFPGADPNLPVPARDLAGARAELAQSSYDPGRVKVEIGWVAEVPLEEKISLLLQANLAEIGINAEVVRVPWALMTERASKAETTPNASAIYVSTAFPDPDSMLYSMYHSEAAGTWMSMEWLQDADVDRLLDEARVEVDPDQRNQLYGELQARILELQPDIFGYEQLAAFAKQPYVTIPTLEDPDQNVAGTMAGNWLFRLIEVDR